jgi:hypothetical protein
VASYWSWERIVRSRSRPSGTRSTVIGLTVERALPLAVGQVPVVPGPVQQDEPARMAYAPVEVLAFPSTRAL